MTGTPEGVAGRIDLEFDSAPRLSLGKEVIEFYDNAGPDYRHWSPGFNMHLGYYRRGISLSDREKMLEQMNLEVAARLRPDLVAQPVLIDLGCGVGAIARSIAKNYPRTVIKCVTNVPSQV